MSVAIPANITADLTDLSGAYNVAAPLTNAPSTTVALLSLQADGVVTDLDAAVLAAAGSLDGFVAPVMPGPIATAVMGLLTSCQTQSALVFIRGVLGRVATNLAQAA